MRSIVSKFILFFIVIFFQNCFDYEETIFFKKGFSGYVEINYTVPINPKNGRSLIRFLPISKEDIEARINKGIFSKNIQIRDFSIGYLDKWDIEQNSLFRRKARVGYKVDFQELSSLDGVLLGYLFVKKRGNTITIKREFKSVMKNVDQETSTGEKRIRSETHRLLGESAIQFRVIYPPTSECRSNRGEIGLGNLYYKFPLIDTIEKPGNKTWDYTITTLY
ncbi:MAG: hypothetical protein H7A24_06725 [Leptospiraceae bacterium]|nr:hypothetical protein [Leptospiraceae bacterium]MCP5511556.1 hypothetical protein [Leptospiraceae bacterium]